MRTKKVLTSLRICAVTNRRSRQAIYMWQRPRHAQFEFTDDRFIAVAFIMQPNNRFKWTAFTKEGAGVSLFFCLFVVFFWRGGRGGGGGGGGGGLFFPGAGLLQ